MSSDPTLGRRFRADRTRNRDAILSAAREAFARADAADESVSMNEIARAAKVGVATLYRHFPTRDELANAVYQTKLDEVTARVRARTSHAEAFMALRTWVSEFASFMLATRGMMDTLRSAWQSSTATSSAPTANIRDVIAEFLTAGVEDDSIRRGLDPMDVTVAILALLSTTPPDDDGTRAVRLLNLFIDGFAAQPQRDTDEASKSARLGLSDDA
ncbi:MAG: helix-turn-helix domain-containing protein [Lacisediminihabitans sp.]